MKLIAVEEHFLTKEIRKEWKRHTDDGPTLGLHMGEIEDRPEDIGNTRLSLMNETGIDVQVLSLTSPSLHNLGNESVPLARQTNDFIAKVVRSNPDRLQFFFFRLSLPIPPGQRCPEISGSNRS